MSIKLKDSSGPGYVGRAIKAMEFQERLASIVEDMEAAPEARQSETLRQYRIIMDETNAFILSNVETPTDPVEARRVLMEEVTEVEYDALLNELRGKKASDKEATDPKAALTDAPGANTPPLSLASPTVAPPRALSSKQQPNGGSRPATSGKKSTARLGTGG